MSKIQTKVHKILLESKLILILILHRVEILNE